MGRDSGCIAASPAATPFHVARAISRTEVDVSALVLLALPDQTLPFPTWPYLTEPGLTGPAHAMPSHTPNATDER